MATGRRSPASSAFARQLTSDLNAGLTLQWRSGPTEGNVNRCVR